MVQIGDTFQDGSAVFKVKKFGVDGALVGSVIWYAGAGTPENYLLCDGSAVSRKDYADLFAVIGTTYGAGNGSTTFNLPLLTDGRFIEGSNIAGTQHEAGLPNITGTGPLMRKGTESGCFVTTNLPMQHMSQSEDWHIAFLGGPGIPTPPTLDASRCSVIYGNSNTVQPKALTMYPIIRYI